MQARSHISKRFSFLLVLLVLGHEFNHVIKTNALIDNHGNNEVFNHDEDTTPSQDVIKNKDSVEEDHRYFQAQNIEKRGALFAASVATSLLNIGLDVILKVKGCCFFFRSICRNVKEFDRRKKNVAKYLELNNKLWDEVKALKDWILKSNKQNAQIWLEIKRIGDTQKQIVELLSPSIIKKFNTEQLKLKQAIAANDKNVVGLTYKQLSDRFESPFDSAKGTAMQLSGITGLVGVKIATSAFKFYKIRQISKALRSSYGAKLLKAAPAAKKFFGFSKSSLSGHIKQTSKSMYKTKFSGGKYGKFLKGAGKLTSVASIAMDVYSMVQKIRNCKRISDNAKRAVKAIRKAEDESRKMFDDLNKYKRELQVKGVQYIKEQLGSSDLHDILKNFRELAESAPNEARDMRSAAPIISRFLAEIGNANLPKITILQKVLIDGLKKITIYYKCYLRKLQLVRYVTDECKKGTSSMQDLYNRGTQSFGSNSQYCIVKNGLPYTHLKDVQALVMVEAKTQHFNPDCVMNNQAIKRAVCVYKNDGYTPQQTASKMAGLNIEQVKVIFKSCPKSTLNQRKIGQICSLRKLPQMSESAISKIMGISIARLRTVKC